MRQSDPHIHNPRLVRDLFGDDQLIRDLRRIVQIEQSATPVAVMLRRCTRGWIATLARMVVLS